LHYALAMNRVALSALLVSCFSFGALGCSAATASAPAHSPSVAFAASASDVLQSCTLEGAPRVVATHVSPKAGVAAVVEGGRIQLRFATTGSPALATTYEPEGVDVVASPAAPVAANGSSNRADVELPDHRHLVAWTAGTLEGGLRVRLVTVGQDGSTEAPIDLGNQGSAIGRPAVAVTRAGNGVVAFIESNGDGFQVVESRVTCAIP
jgi:hypothetical protein